jgi:molybdopterin-synthase adenylyltransferase
MSPTYSAAISRSLHEDAVRHLLRNDGQEDLCFALWSPSVGTTRSSALIRRLILPSAGERMLHGNASFMPEFFERAVSEAAATGCGLAFMHSHPGGRGWQHLSSDDFAAEHDHAGAVKGGTGLPFVGLTLAGDQSWSARFWMKLAPRTYGSEWCRSVRIVGDTLKISRDSKLAPVQFRTSMKRTISAWGSQNQQALAQLHVAIVGAGSVGSIVAEALARTGVERITLLDFDSVEGHNLDRLLHANVDDARQRRSKVKVLARALALGATSRSFEVTPLEWSVVEPAGFRAVLDADVVFSCVDRPWPRSVLNLVSYGHLIPVIDGGIAAELNRAGTGMGHADWRAHLVAPGRRCLECLGQYDPGFVGVEREGWLDDPEYIKRLPVDHPLRRNENVFGFALSTASFEILQLLAAVVAPWYSDPGHQMYHFVEGGILDSKRDSCKATCPYPSLTAHGDQSGVDFTGRHRIAERARRRRAKRSLSSELRSVLWRIKASLR